MARAILAYGIGARPETAEEGQEFYIIPTDEKFVFINGVWQEMTPSTPKKVLPEENIIVEEKAEEQPAPKAKKTTKKKETK